MAASAAAVRPDKTKDLSGRQKIAVVHAASATAPRAWRSAHPRPSPCTPRPALPSSLPRHGRPAHYMPAAAGRRSRSLARRAGIEMVAIATISIPASWLGARCNLSRHFRHAARVYPDSVNDPACRGPAGSLALIALPGNVRISCSGIQELSHRCQGIDGTRAAKRPAGSRHPAPGLGGARSSALSGRGR
jgi:hypothetical protein